MLSGRMLLIFSRYGTEGRQNNGMLMYHKHAEAPQKKKKRQRRGRRGGGVQEEEESAVYLQH